MDKIGSGFTPTYNYLNQAKESEDKAIQEIASGEKNLSEDVSSAIIAQFLEGGISQLTQGISNANEATALTQIADGALSSLSESATRMQELSVASNNAALNSDQQAALQSEFEALQSSMQDTLESASYNGKPIFGNEFTFSLGDSTTSLSLDGIDTSLAEIGSQESIEQLFGTIQSAQSSIGSTQNGIESSLNASLKALEEETSMKSQIADTDMAEAINEQNLASFNIEKDMLIQAHQTNYLEQKMAALLG